MLKRSCLLEYLITYAEALKNNDGKKALSANYFVISVLKTIEAIDNNQIPNEIDNDGVKLELDAVCDLLKKYNFNSSLAVKSIAEVVYSSEYQSFMDELMFGKILKSAEAKAIKSGKDIVDTTTFLNLIFDEPTAAIKKYILECPQRVDRDTDAKIDGIKDSTIDANEEVQTLELNNEQLMRQAPNTLALADVVKATRRIQSVLLEKIYGQDQAVNTFVSGYFQAQLASCSNNKTKKPQATFLFAGPPGVGKTFLAEQAAEALRLPYCRFDMSEYSDKEANLEFCGSDKVYKNAKEGNVTGFVKKNPKCILLFDEIEKAHINIIYLFLQILDAGRIRDNYTDEEVSFANAIIIFTTNVGKLLYDDPLITNLSSLPRKKIVKALSAEINPNTNVPAFPAAICSRFSSGNVVMFNHLTANNLLTIASKEIRSSIEDFEALTKIKVKVDPKVSAAVMFSEGGKADARTVKGRAKSFFHDELYELLRLISSSEKNNAVEKLKYLDVSISLDGCDKQVAKLFSPEQKYEILIFASEPIASECRSMIRSAQVYTTDNIEKAQDYLFNHDIALVLCDIRCGLLSSADAVLNAEDIRSEGITFLNMVIQKYGLPVFVIKNHEKDLTPEEEVSFLKIGARGTVTIHSGVPSNSLDSQICTRCNEAFLQANMLELAKASKVLTYKTSQSITKNKSRATITLFDFRMHVSTDAKDSHSVLDSASKPDVCFDDVIGAEDAKEELRYFVQFLRNPKEFVRKGLKAPRGVLLYGPPGTGKTLLAKAMAGESDVTFLAAEGNQFLKKYVGEGSDSVHSLFATARKYAPAILFVDEIDAIAKERATTGVNDTTGDVLTAFLTEMDGFNVDSSKPVFVLAATNYDVEPGGNKSLDSALLRRFDRRIFVDLPNKEERKAFVHKRMEKSHNILLSEEQIENIATRSTGMSLAELDSVFELAMRSVVRMNQNCVDDKAFEEAFETFNGGEVKKWSTDSLLRTARHEAGHALLCWLSGEKPSYLTIVARGSHGGYMQHADSEGKGLYTKKELLDRIRTALGGRASEIVYYGADEGISTCASGDLKSATQIALQMICNYGMDEEFGLAYFDSENVKSINDLRTRINKILENELQTAIKVISTYQKNLDELVNVLMEKNHLKGSEIDEILRHTQCKDK